MEIRKLKQNERESEKKKSKNLQNVPFSDWEGNGACQLIVLQIARKKRKKMKKKRERNKERKGLHNRSN